eukprot:3357208-Pyramimonas_sp.AAC.1
MGLRGVVSTLAVTGAGGPAPTTARVRACPALPAALGSARTHRSSNKQPSPRLRQSSRQVNPGGTGVQCGTAKGPL